MNLSLINKVQYAFIFTWQREKRNLITNNIFFQSFLNEAIFQTTALNSGTMDGGGFLSSVSKRKDLPDDLACFLQQQKQRQARLETTMRSFPSTGDMEQDKMDQKKKRSTHEVRIILTKFLFVKIYTYSIVEHSNNKIKFKTLQ